MGTFQHIQRENDHSSQTLIQPQLEIGREDDAHEKEANHVADKVMRMKDHEEDVPAMTDGEEAVQMMVDEPGNLQIMKMVDEPSGDQLAPAHIESALAANKGQGQSLPSDIQKEMNAKMGADFSQVKVHTDQNSVQMNKELGAKAFTHSNNIYFNQGQYNPANSQGKHLLAHELTHTVQQGAAIQRQPAGNLSSVSKNMIRPKIQKTDGEEQPTAFGTFKAPDYHAVTQVSDKKEVGVMMTIQFYPNAKVNATSIGLVQITKGVNEGKPVTEGLKNDRQAKSGVAANYFVDVLDDHPSPVYAASKEPDTGKDADKLSSYSADAATKSGNPDYNGITYNFSGGKYGYRYMQGDKVLEGPAEHYDHPLIPNLPDESGMMFETIAIALDGEEKGTYYGAVEWGYYKDASGKFTIMPLKTVSEGIPSEKFFTAAKLFNESKTSDIRYVTNKPAEIRQGSTIKTLKAGVGIEVIPESQRTIQGAEWVAMFDPMGGNASYWIKVADYDKNDLSKETVDLPMIDLYQLSKESILKSEGKDVTLPEHTRVRVLTESDQMSAQKDWNVEVIDGGNYGISGILASSDLVKESYQGK